LNAQRGVEVPQVVEADPATGAVWGEADRFDRRVEHPPHEVAGSGTDGEVLGT
jgi:hypothetical protein